MSNLNIAYRLTIFQKRTTDPSESTALTPTGSGTSIHTDPFQIATIQNLSGWQPYMYDSPKGSPSNATFPQSNVSVGTYQIRLLDVRSGTLTTNLQRWVSAFIGDELGRPRLLGRRVLIEESLDGGITWTGMFAGRITDWQLTDPLLYQITVSDQVDDLKVPIFQYIPTDVDYVNYQMLLPVGLRYSMPPAPADPVVTGSAPLSGIILNRASALVKGYGYVSPPAIELDKTSLSRADNFETQQLRQAYYSAVATNNGSIASSLAQINLYNPANGHSGSFPVRLCTTVDGGPNTPINIIYFTSGTVASGSGAHRVGTSATTNDLPGWAVGVSNFDSSDTADGTSMQFTVTQPLQNPNGNSTAMWLTAHPIQIWQDILDGKFSTRKQDGTIAKTISYDSGAFAALLSDYSYLYGVLPRYDITKTWTAIDFIEKCICEPYSLSFGMTVVASGSTSMSAVTPFSIALPPTGSFPSLSLDDIATTSTPTWQSFAPYSSMTMTYYIDTVSQQTRAQYVASANNKAYSVLIPNAFKSMLYNVFDPDLPPQSLDMDGIGIRTLLTSNTTAKSSSIVQSASNALVNTTLGQMNSAVMGYMRPYMNRFNGGASTVTVDCRRTDTVNALKPGDWTYVDVDMLPNPTLNTRGGTRLFQVSSTANAGAIKQLTLIDSGASGSMNTPIINSVTVDSSSVNAINVNVSTTDTAMVHVEYVLVPLSASMPSTGDFGWTFGGATLSDATTQSIIISPVPTGLTIYVRVREESAANNTLYLPSPWVYASAVTTTLLNPPTGLTVDTISSKAATARWTPVSDFPIEVLLDSPPGTAFRSVTTLMSGSNHYILTGLDLDPSTSHSVAVRHIDTVGGASVLVSASFNASGTAPQLPNLGDVYVLYGNS